MPTRRYTTNSRATADVKAQIAQDTGDRKDMTLVAIAHANEHLAGARIGQLVVNRQLCLGICLGIALGDTHDLARRLHLGPQDNVGSRETAPGHNGFLHAEAVQLALVARQAQARDGIARHDARRALGQRHAGGLGDKRHGTAAPMLAGEELRFTGREVYGQNVIDTYHRIG